MPSLATNKTLRGWNVSGIEDSLYHVFSVRQISPADAAREAVERIESGSAPLLEVWNAQNALYYGLLSTFRDAVFFNPDTTFTALYLSNILESLIVDREAIIEALLEQPYHAPQTYPPTTAPPLLRTHHNPTRPLHLDLGRDLPPPTRVRTRRIEVLRSR